MMHSDPRDAAVPPGPTTTTTPSDLAGLDQGGTLPVTGLDGILLLAAALVACILGLALRRPPWQK